MTADTLRGIARWLSAAVACPVIGFFVAYVLPIGDAPNSSDGVAYLIANAFTLGLFAISYELICPFLFPAIARNLQRSLFCALVIGVCFLVYFYSQIHPGDEPIAPLALVSLRNEIVSMIITALSFIFLGLRGNPIFENTSMFLRRFRED